MPSIPHPFLPLGAIVNIKTGLKTNSACDSYPYQLDYIWNEPQSRNGGHTCKVFLVFFFFLLGLKKVDLLLVQTSEIGRHTQVFGLDLETGRQTFSLGHTFCWKPRYKDMEAGSLPACPQPASMAIPSLALEPTYTEGQLRHPALWTGQLLASWTSCS
jgi:hypothetical protein